MTQSLSVMNDEYKYMTRSLKIYSSKSDKMEEIQSTSLINSENLQKNLNLPISLARIRILLMIMKTDHTYLTISLRTCLLTNF